MKRATFLFKTIAIFLTLCILFSLCLPAAFSAKKQDAPFRVASTPRELWVADGQYATVTAAVAAPEDTVLHYQWYVSPAGTKRFSKSSITAATYCVKMTDSRDGQKIYCVITDQKGHSVTTGTTILKMAITITQQPRDAVAELDQKATVTVQASGKGKLTYQWYYADTGKRDYKRSSVTTNAYRVTMKAARAGRRVYCVITDEAGRAVTTETATLWLPASTPLTITQQPKNSTTTWGEIAKTTVKASGVGKLTYQWYYFDTKKHVFKPSSITGKTYKTKMNGAKEGRRIYCHITDSAGQTIDTQIAVLYLADPIVITKQPTDQTAAIGDLIQTRVKASGKGLAYTWYIRKPGQKRFELSSVTGTTYSTRMTELAEGRQLYCVITDQYGNRVTSKMVTLYSTNACIFGEEIPLGKTQQGYKFEKVCQHCGKKEYVYYDSILTFVDDDAKMQAMLHWEKIIDATGINITAALIGKQMREQTDYDTWSAYAGWDLLSRMQEKGVDFVNHTYEHVRMTTLTEEELHRDFQKCKDTLAQYGVNSSILVYPFNDHNELVDSVAAQYFEAAFCRQDRVITQLETPFNLTRITLNDKHNSQVIPFTKDTLVECYGIKPFSTLKRELEDALSQKGWLVYMAHAYDSPSGHYTFDRHSEQTLIQFCHYVQTLGSTKIVTLTEGIVAAKELDEEP